jgi:hypothetical protein
LPASCPPGRSCRSTSRAPSWRWSARRGTADLAAAAKAGHDRCIGTASQAAARGAKRPGQFGGSSIPRAGRRRPGSDGASRADYHLSRVPRDQ